MSRVVIQFEAEENGAAEAIDRLSGLIVGRPRVFAPRELPPSPMIAKKFEELAQAIAKAIRPRPNQLMRRETLQFVLSGTDTFFGQGGDPDPALRNATGALSKALRRFAPYEISPLDILVERRREVFTDGALKGQYRGTRYVLKKLGKRVRDILKSWGAI